MIRISVVVASLVTLASLNDRAFPLQAQDIERRLEQVAYNVDFAVLSVWYNKPGDQVDMQAVGTGFLQT